MQQKTLCFLCSGNEVLLGFKKRGFGAGNYVGIGGTVEAGETVLETAVRELYEETGIVAQPADFAAKGHITFQFPAKPGWNQQVHLFLLKQWQGEPQETDEIRPSWVAQSEIPFELMWDDARYWLPHLLRGESLVGRFVFDAGGTAVVEWELQEKG
ncbi:MAG: 8-oxo-dGTP diphosphatase [Chloroflexota bacterium]